MANPYRLSIVIPTYRRCASVRRALVALMRQTLPAEQYEVVVSIDGSEDGTREMLAQLSAPYRLHWHWQPNKGRAAACNAGIRLAGGELIVLLDDDMEPAPQFLAAHLRAHATSSSVGVMGAAPITADGASPPVMQYVAAKFNNHLQRLARPDHRLMLWDFYSGNFSISRHRLLDVGGFDEAFTLYGNEDLELSIRLRRAGVRLAYSPDAVAYQHNTKSFAALARDNFEEGRTAVLLVSKHPEALPELRLGAYSHISLKRRFLQSALLGLSAIWSGVPDVSIRLVEWLERHHPPRLDRIYLLILDYFYWLGARAALREAGEPGRG